MCDFSVKQVNRWNKVFVLDYKPHFLNKALNLINLVVYKGHKSSHGCGGTVNKQTGKSPDISSLISPLSHSATWASALSESEYAGLSEQRDEKGLHYSVLIFFSFESALWINREFQPLACLSRVF